jgi:hypothetical protein
MKSASSVGWVASGKFALDGVYSYAGNGFWNLDYALERMETGRLSVPTYGASSMEGFLVLIGASNTLKIAYHWDGAMNVEVTRFKGRTSGSERPGSGRSSGGSDFPSWIATSE